MTAPDLSLPRTWDGSKWNDGPQPGSGGNPSGLPATKADVDAAVSALSGVYGPGSVQWLIQVGAGFDFAFTAISTVDSATGLPTAGTVKWPDGTTGAFTGTTDGVNGYTGYTAAYGTKTLTASGITYDATTGLALAPTLAVA